MFKLFAVTSVVTLATSVAMMGAAKAQRANVPGIIGSAVEGNVEGAVGSAMGYDYWGRSGYYPGSRGNPYGWQYGPRYGAPYYGDQSYRYPAGRYQYQTGYRAVAPNPPVDAEPYRAVIVNPKDNRAVLRFSVNGQFHELKAGQELEFEGRRPRIIQFDRGNGGETARYTLADGRFAFTPTKNGWELYRHPLEIAKTSQEETAGQSRTEVVDQEVPRNEAPATPPSQERF